MICVLIAVGIIIISFILSVLSDKFFPYSDLDEFAAYIRVAGYIISIGLILIFIANHTAVNYNIQKKQIEYNGLIERLEIINSNYEDVSKSEVIKDITEWNKEVYCDKYYTESLWTNWLCSQKYADSLHYIDIN